LFGVAEVVASRFEIADAQQETVVACDAKRPVASRWNGNLRVGFRGDLIEVRLAGETL
jgi:hypothetical protein